MGRERCGKINSWNSAAESWTGIGVVTGGAVVALIRQWPHLRNTDANWRINLVQILQEVRAICKTRNQLYMRGRESKVRLVRCGPRYAIMAPTHHSRVCSP